MDAIFLCKLFAMLGMALVGITVWSSLGFIGVSVMNAGIPDLPAPAVGWPLFSVLMVLYFSMAYLLLGSLFLDRKSTRLNSSHVKISYAVFCLKKKNKYID